MSGRRIFDEKGVLTALLAVSQCVTNMGASLVRLSAS